MSWQPPSSLAADSLPHWLQAIDIDVLRRFKCKALRQCKHAPVLGPSIPTLGNHQAYDPIIPDNETAPQLGCTIGHVQKGDYLEGLTNLTHEALQFRTRCRQGCFA